MPQSWNHILKRSCGLLQVRRHSEMKRCLPSVGFQEKKDTEQSFTFSYSFLIFSICSYSNPNRDWVARKAFVSIETICSIREKVYLVAHEI